MILIKNEHHGILPVHILTETQKKAGWTLYEPAEISEVIDLASMSKNELELYARGFGIELDRRQNKENMIKDFNEQNK